MKVSATTLPLAEFDVDLLLVPVLEDDASETLAALSESFGEGLYRAAEDFSGKADQTHLHYPEQGRARRLSLIGLGARTDLNAERLRRAGAAGAKATAQTKAGTVGFVLPDTKLDAEVASQAVTEGFVLQGYRFEDYKTKKHDDFAGPDRLILRASDDKGVRRGAERGRVLAEAACTARDLVNLSPHDKTPTLLAKAIERNGKKHGYDVSVWDKALIEEEKMGGLLAVNRGSVAPPTFTVMTWQPANAVNDRPVVLVGKGVVYDTGGLSLKPTKDSMDFMKSDMAGAAAVVGAMEALARLEIPLYVVGFVPASDNRPGVDAYVPGEVVTMHSGATVEVLNTDAEGRMLLADALSYAKTYKPELVLDLATLTGAAVVALGNEVAAVMTNETDGAEDRLAQICAAGDRSGERVHPLPMYADYFDLLKSDVADLKNVGGRAAGTITAGKFLEHFVAYPWLHLDIAGPSFAKKARPYRPYGGSGFGVRLLAEFLRAYARPGKR